MASPHQEQKTLRAQKSVVMNQPAAGTREPLLTLALAAYKPLLGGRDALCVACSRGACERAKDHPTGCANTQEARWKRLSRFARTNDLPS
eukprot:4948580-Amphidinium_carterae.2